MPSPPLPRVIINGGERILLAEEGRPLLFAAMRERIFIPSACGGRARCGQCRVRVLSGAPDHVAEERTVLAQEEMARGVHLACQLRVGGGDLRIELPGGYLAARAYRGRVSGIRDLATDLREVTIDLPKPPVMTFLAGQYVQFVMPGTENAEPPVYRAYSMASPPSNAGCLTLLVARVPGGQCTSYVFEQLRSGQAVTVNGPFGSFCLHESDRPLLFVAGGAGIAPIRAILLDMADREVRRPATFFYSARTASDLVYQDDLRALEERLAGFRFVPVLSRPRPQDRWEGETGGLPSVLSRRLDRLEGFDAYLCGGPGLIEASISALKARGLPAARVFYDKFS